MHPLMWKKCFKVDCILEFVILFLSSSCTAYKQYYVEDLCSSGSLTIYVPNTGIASAGILKATRHTSYSFRMSCDIQLVASADHHVLVSFREIDFAAKFAGDCTDYIQVHERSMCKYYRSVEEDRHFQSSDFPPHNVLKLQYRTRSPQLDNKTMSGYAGFTLSFTSFHTGSKCSDNRTDLFQCSNDHCIWSGLTCDGHNNCGDLSDEDPSGDSNCGEGGRGPTVLIILALLIVILLVIMCVATLMCSKNERVRRFSAGIRRRTLSIFPGSSSSPRRSRLTDEE